MRVLLVTTWDTPCGIASHARYLKDSVEAADPSITIVPCPAALDPAALSKWSLDGTDRLVHLNYQANLHSRWTVDEIQRLQRGNRKVLVTFHDTGVPNSEQCRAICAAADYYVVHEPADDLGSNGEVLRMGVPGPQIPVQYGYRGAIKMFDPPPPQGMCFTAWVGQPILGTIGFPFGWKCYDQLAEITAACGWALVLIAPGATPEQIAHWRALNPALYVRTDFVPAAEAVSLLAGCDATAFTYVCYNTGQSGAILQGIAARKPLIALSTCRQFRALWEDPLGGAAILWASTFEHVAAYLRGMKIGRVDPGIVALAKQESWTTVGQRYAAIYKELSA